MDQLLEDALNSARFNPGRLTFLEMYCAIQDKNRAERTIHEIRFLYYCTSVVKYLYHKPAVQISKLPQTPIQKPVERIRVRLTDLYKIASIGMS